jgi:hypothetical protein
MLLANVPSRVPAIGTVVEKKVVVAVESPSSSSCMSSLTDPVMSPDDDDAALHSRKRPLESDSDESSPGRAVKLARFDVVSDLPLRPKLPRGVSTASYSSVYDFPLRIRGLPPTPA